MLHLIIKAIVSGIIVAAASEVARRWPTVGGLIVSLPLVSLLAFLWLWNDTGDPRRIAALSMSTFWFFLPSMPLFLILPGLLRSGMAFWLAFAIGIAITMARYAAMFWAAPRLGLKL
jgi:ABC-type nickel/cobalt efflux system permease component RcnA